MGAYYFCYTEDGTDAEEVFGKLCRNAEREYGDNMYNGTISTTSLRHIHHNDKPYTKTYENKMYKRYGSSDNGSKWSCDCEDLGIIGYEVKKLTHKRVPQGKGAYITIYKVISIDDYDSDIGKAFPSKKEAEEYLKNHFAEYTGTVEIVEKKIWKPSCDGTKTVGTYKVETRVVKKKPSRPAKESIITPIHRYMFHGWAAE